MTIMKQVTRLHINHRAREWCKLPYPGHRYGCPNYDRKEVCPPQAPLIEDFFNLNKPLLLIAIKFDLANHIRRMRVLHPKWTDRQARCVLYWQSGVNNDLKIAALQLCNKRPELTYTLLPEAMGVNVLTTALDAGIPVKIKPIDIVYKIALLGEPK